MPAPTSKYSVDYYFYKYIFTPLSEKICFIHPNYISIANIVVLTPLMVCGLLYNWSLGAFVGIALLYSFFDCMDGSVARACDKKSKLGAALDSVSDILFTSVAAVLIVFLMSQKYGLSHWKTIVVAVSLFFTVFVSAVGINYSHNEGDSIKILDFVNNNTLLISPLLAAFAWWLVNRA